MRRHSFDTIGITEILQHSGVPKGSFYHYFANKEDFGLAVADAYHQEQMALAHETLGDLSQPPLVRLAAFFLTARKAFFERQFKDGCLMCNLSTELGATHTAFQTALTQQWQALSAAISECLEEADLAEIGLAHLTPLEAAEFLINSWSGALTRMKADNSPAPLDLFLKSTLRLEPHDHD